MSENLRAAVRITVEARAAEAGAKRTNAAIDSIIARQSRAMAANDNYGSSIERQSRAAARAANDNDKLGRGIADVGKASVRSNGLLSRLNSTLLSTRGIIAAVGAGFAALGFAALSDEIGLMEARLRLATSRFGSFAQAQVDVEAIASRTRSGLTATGDLYAVLNMQATTLGITQGQVAIATETLGKSLKISGVNAQETSSIIRQLSQSLASGKLSGDEFNVVNENGGRFMMLLADSMGVARGALKGLASEGKITSQVLIKALTDPKLVAGIEKEFGQIPVTFSDIKTAALNTGMLISGAFARGFGLSDSLAVIVAKVQSWGLSLVPTFEMIGREARKVFESLKPVIDVFTGSAGKAFGLLVTNMGLVVSLTKGVASGLAVLNTVTTVTNSIRGSLAATIAFERALGATTTISALYSAAMKVAQGATRGFTAALLSNPVTAIAAALTTAIVLLYEFRDSITIGGGSLTTLGDLGRAAFEYIGPALSALGNLSRNVFSAIGSFFSTAFSGISSVFKSVFGDLDFSLQGILIGAARVADGVVGVFRGSFRALVVLWEGLPEALGPGIMSVVTGTVTLVKGIFAFIQTVWNAIVGFGQQAAGYIRTAFNSIAGFIENIVNGITGAINTAIAGANLFGAAIAPLSEVRIARIEAPAPEPTGFAKLGGDMADAFASGFGNEAESAVRGLLGRADEIGRQRRANGGASAAGAATPGSVAAPGATGDGKKTDAQKEAERRAKAQREFFQGLQEEVRLAGLLPIEAGNYRKQLELQKILGRELNGLEKARVDGLMGQARTSKFLTDARQEEIEGQRELASERALSDRRLAGATEQQIERERSMLTWRNGALASGVDIEGQAYRQQEAARRSRLEELDAIRERNRALDEGVELARQHSARFNLAEGITNRARQLGALNDARAAGRISQAVYDEAYEGLNRASRDAGYEARAVWGDSIADLGDQIEGRWGKAISKVGQVISAIADAARGDTRGLGAIGGIIDIIGRGRDGLPNQIGKAASDAAGNALQSLIGGNGKKSALATPLSSLTQGFTGFKKDFRNLFAKGGDFQAGLGSVLGKAGMGAQIGSATSAIAGAIGIKLNSTGSQIGGALGGLAGPIGAIGGSVLGGLIGNLFGGKRAQSNSIITGQGEAQTTGTGEALFRGARGAATSVQEGLSQIAEQLGGQVGKYLVSIGTYDGKWRVSTSGQSGEMSFGKKNKSKSTLFDFGEDQAGAIAFAIADAIKDGAITGLGEFAQKALSKLGAEAAVQLLTEWRGVMNEFEQATNPVAFGIKSITDRFSGLRTKMTEVGASASDLSKLNEAQSLQMQNLFKQQTAGYRDILAQLNDDAGGVSKLSQLTAQMGELTAFRSSIAAGESINQDDFTSLVGKIINNAGDVYGSQTGMYQAIVRDVKSLTQSALYNVEKQFDAQAAADATRTAINKQTDDVTARQDITNQLLQELVNLQRNSSSGSSSSGNDYVSGYEQGRMYNVR